MEGESWRDLQPQILVRPVGITDVLGGENRIVKLELQRSLTSVLGLPSSAQTSRDPHVPSSDWGRVKYSR